MVYQFFFFQFLESFYYALFFTLAPIFQTCHAPYMVKIYRWHVQPFERSLYLPSNFRFAGLKSFCGNIVRKPQPAQLRKAFAANRFAFGFKISGCCVKVIYATSRCVNNHLNAFVVVVHVGKSHSPKAEHGYFFTRSAIISISHSLLLFLKA